MKSWIISASAIAVLFVLAEIILNEGELKKYTVGILRLVFIVAVFVPLIGLFTGNFELNADAPISSHVGSDFGEYVTEKRNSLSEAVIEAELEKMGIRNSEVNIFSYYNGEKYVVNAVEVNLSESGISMETENIISIEDVKNVVTAHIDVAKELVSVYGWI